MKKVFLVIIFLVCFKNLLFSDEYDKAKELIRAEILGRYGEILYLSKINLGIPGGENWICVMSERVMIIYTINNETINRIWVSGYLEISQIMYRDSNSRSNVDLMFDILHNIPGTRIGNLAVVFGNFNGNGRDEILLFSIGGSEHMCYIYGYDNYKEEIAEYFYCRFNITSPNGPSPVEFINYREMDGIRVYFFDFLKNKYNWIFFAWDEGSRKYKEITELGENAEYSSFTLIRPEDSRHIGNEPVFPSVLASDEAEDVVEAEIVVDSSVPEISENDDEPNNRRTPFWVWAAIGGGLLLIVFVMVIIKRKK